MNRPRIVGLISAALGSTAAFVVLGRWQLAGTITGALLMPVIFTLVSFFSHEGMERTRRWARTRLGKESAETLVGSSEEDEAMRVNARSGPATRVLQWSVAVLAVGAFAASVYSLAKPDSTDVMILREKEVVTVTVTTDLPALSFARSQSDADDTETTAPLTETTQTSSSTVTTDSDQEDPAPDPTTVSSVTTETTDAGSGTATTLP